jgi:hypothetical protein
VAAAIIVSAPRRVTSIDTPNLVEDIPASVARSLSYSAQIRCGE